MNPFPILIDLFRYIPIIDVLKFGSKIWMISTRYTYINDLFRPKLWSEYIHTHTHIYNLQ